MAIEKIAEMFAELGFKVDTKGLKTFEKHLSKLKQDFAGIKSATVKYTDETVKSDNRIKKSSRSKTNALIADRRKLARATKTTASSIDEMFGIGRRRGSLANSYAKQEARDKAKSVARGAKIEADVRKRLAKTSGGSIDNLFGIGRDRSSLAKEYAKQEEVARKVKERSITKGAKFEADVRKRLARTSGGSIDDLFGINRGQSSLAKEYAKQEAKDLEDRNRASKKAKKLNDEYKRSLDGIVRKMSPLQHEYEQLKRHQDMLNKEMAEGTGDAKRYEASLARIQSRMKQLDGMRGADGSLPFREQRGAVGRPSSRGFGLGLNASSGLFGAFGAVAAGIGTNRLQISTEQTQAKMGMVLSPEESAKQIKFASDNARQLGVNAVNAAEGYANLMVQAQRMEIPMSDTQNLFMGVTEASVAMGLSLDQQKGIYKAFSDMLAKGTVNAEELKGQLG